MKVGNLVRITRIGIGVPPDSLALIIDKRGARSPGDSTELFVVRLVGSKGKASRMRRYLARDLKVIS